MTFVSPALTLTLSRYFDAPPDRVFDAWTGPDWGDWLPPRGATCKVTAIDPRRDGRFEAAMSMPDGRHIAVSGTYREVQRPERLVFTWHGGCSNAATLVTLTFRAEGTGTRMTLRQEGFDQDAMRTGFESGWSGEGGSFDKLVAFLKREAVHG